MKETGKRVAGVVGSAVLLSSMGLGAAVAVADEVTPEAAPVDRQEEQAASARQTAPEVKGEFAFTQQEVTPADVIARAMALAPKYLCGAQESPVAATTDAATVGEIVFDGAVKHPCTMTAAEIGEAEQQRLIMGCSCSGNPADGASSVNAEVTGVSVVSLLNIVAPDADANTIVFTSADGYRVALPLDYVTQRYCPLVFNVNGSPIEETMGGENQLWLGSTSARYFARDIVRITLESRDVAPDAPDGDAAHGDYANLPNIGVAFGGTVE